MEHGGRVGRGRKGGGVAYRFISDDLFREDLLLFESWMAMVKHADGINALFICWAERRCIIHRRFSDR